MREDDLTEFAAELPAELRVPRPRSVQISSPDGWFGLIVGLGLLLAGTLAIGFICFSTIRQKHESMILQRDGRDTGGTVINSHGGHGNSTVSYSFTVDGVSHRGKAQMPDYPLILHESEPIIVRYLPYNPDLNHPKAWEWSARWNLFPDIFLLFFGAGGAVALVALLKDRKLARLGKVTKGIVTKCVPNKRQFRVEYMFRKEDGVQMAGSCDCWEKYQEGDQIWILYLANKPRKNHCYPLAFFEVSPP